MTIFSNVKTNGRNKSIRLVFSPEFKDVLGADYDELYIQFMVNNGGFNESNPYYGENKSSIYDKIRKEYKLDFSPEEQKDMLRDVVNLVKKSLNTVLINLKREDLIGAYTIMYDSDDVNIVFNVKKTTTFDVTILKDIADDLIKAVNE